MLDGTRLPAAVIEDLKRILEDFPGESELVLEVHTSAGPRLLKLGEGYRVAAATRRSRPSWTGCSSPARPLALATSLIRVAA